MGRGQHLGSSSKHTHDFQRWHQFRADWKKKNFLHNFLPLMLTKTTTVLIQSLEVLQKKNINNLQIHTWFLDFYSSVLTDFISRSYSNVLYTISLPWVQSKLNGDISSLSLWLLLDSIQSRLSLYQCNIWECNCFRGNARFDADRCLILFCSTYLVNTCTNS